MLGAVVIPKLILVSQLRFTDGAGDCEADSSGLELRSFGLLILLSILPLSFDLLLSPRHLSLFRSLSGIEFAVAVAGFDEEDDWEIWVG